MTNRFLITYGYYFRNYYRSRSFYLMLLLVLLISGLMVYLSFRYINKLPDFIPALKGKTISTSLKEDLFLYIWAFVLSDLPVFAAVFFGSPAISSEIENRTAFQIFPLPIGRSVLLMGKYLASVSVTLAITAIYVFMEFITYTLVFPTQIPVTFLSSLGLLVVFIFSISAFTFLVSSIFKKNLYAYITVFLIYFIIFSAINIVFELIYSYNPFFLLANAASIVERVFINVSTSTFAVNNSIAGAPFSSIMVSLMVMVLYLVVSIVASLLLFENKEVK
ncbi:MAG: ABC transporter permease [Candidatus Thermoplasmatota archaeon]|nr:ABC transporter permease [Candidatus Thermoplasmatota archaeon]